MGRFQFRGADAGVVFSTWRLLFGFHDIFSDVCEKSQESRPILLDVNINRPTRAHPHNVELETERSREVQQTHT